MCRSIPYALLVLFCGTCLAGCAIDVQSRMAEDVTPSAFRTFAFGDWFVTGELIGSPDEEELLKDVHVAVRRELVSRGLEPRPVGEAELVLEISADVEVKSRRNDPFFTIYTTEKYEKGTLSILVRDARSEERVWDGSASKFLRVVARGMGTTKVRYVERDGERDWDVDAMVGKMLARFL